MLATVANPAPSDKKCYVRAPVQRVIELLGHWLWARVALLAIAFLVLVPNLGGPGLWEPQELAVADRAVARADKARKQATEPGKPAAEAPAPAPASRPRAAPTPTPSGGGAAPSAAPAPEPDEEEDVPVVAAPPPPPEKRGACPKAAPTDTGARTLTERLAAQNTTDRGMRWPLTLLGLLCVAGIAGIGFRLGSTRAGLIAGLVLLSFPLLSLQARQLTSEIGTPAGATLIVYGLTFALRPGVGLWLIVDAIASACALAIGCWIAFLSGGALLGVLIPVGAVAVAGGLGWTAVRETGVLAARGGLTAWSRITKSPRRHLRLDDRPGLGLAGWLPAVVTLIATLGAITVITILAIQMYDLRDPIPGTRALWGKSIVPSECWSEALGGLWRFDDDLGATYDVAFEQIAFGTFPWGLAAPIAIGALLASHRPERRYAGALTLAWAGGSWLATVAFQRKVGFTVYAGFPAMALAIGLWIDQLLDRVSDPDVDDEGPRIGLLAGLFILLGVIALGKDLQTFPERLTSLLLGKDAIKYPKNAMLFHIPLRAWVLVLGALVATTFALGLWLWRPGDNPIARMWRRRSQAFLLGSLAATFLMAMFWIHGWHRALSRNLSSKQVFESYHALAKDGDVLGIVGDMGNAPRYYAGATWDKIPNRDGLVTFLQRTDDKRVFALAPASDLCAIHKTFSGKPYYVLDDTNARTLLLSNKLDNGASDKNPLARAILRAEPTTDIKTRPESKIVFDDRIELIGWTMPARVGKGDDFYVTLFFKVLEPVGGAWKIFAHFDSQAGGPRFQGDHDPINNRCQTSFWQKGDYIVDTFKVEAGDMSSLTGAYNVWIGFFVGSSGNYKNMKVVAAPPGGKDDVDRVKLSTLILR
jgi:hypothetical protein